MPCEHTDLTITVDRGNGDEEICPICDDVTLETFDGEDNK